MLVVPADDPASQAEANFGQEILGRKGLESLQREGPLLGLHHLPFMMPQSSGVFEGK